VGRIGSGPQFSKSTRVGSGRVGLKKLDPCPILIHNIVLYRIHGSQNVMETYEISNLFNSESKLFIILASCRTLNIRSGNYIGPWIISDRAVRAHLDRLGNTLWLDASIDFIMPVWCKLLNSPGTYNPNHGFYTFDAGNEEL